MSLPTAAPSASLAIDFPQTTSCVCVRVYQDTLPGGMRLSHLGSRVETGRQEVC